MFCANTCVRQATKLPSLESLQKMDLCKELANLEMQRKPPDFEAAKRHLLEVIIEADLMRAGLTAVYRIGPEYHVARWI